MKCPHGQLLSALLLSIFMSLAPTTAAAHGKHENEHSAVLISIQGFESRSGSLLVALWKDHKLDLKNLKKAIKVKVLRLDKKHKTVNLSFKRLHPGQYAISVIHDENSNGKLDTSWLGIPAEGVGLSNNPKSKFGPPDYADSLFKLGNKVLKLNIKLKYL